MSIRVLDFNKEITVEDNNPFLQVLHEPIFNIMVYVDGKFRELTLKMSGEVKCPDLKTLKDFNLESYRNYLIIVDFLLGEFGERLRESWRLSKEDFRELIFELYFCLIKEHTKCGILKKAFLVLIGLWKFYAGRKLR